MAASRFRPPKTVRLPERPAPDWQPPVLRRSRRGDRNLSLGQQRFAATKKRVKREGDGRLLSKAARRAKRMGRPLPRKVRKVAS